MKTSEEMARSVIQRASAHKAARKRNIITLTAAFLCVCGIGIAAIMAHSPSKPDTLQVQSTTGSSTNGETVIATSRVSMLRFLSSGTESVEMEKDVKMPYEMELRVKDLTGLTKDEAEDLCAEEQQYAQDVISKYKEDLSSWSIGQYKGDSSVITTICAGAISIQLDDPKLVENIHITADGDGQLGHIRGEYLLEENFREYYMDYWDVLLSYYDGGIGMIWHLSSLNFHELCNDSTIPLSSFRDTITVTVNFKDGTQDIHVIDIMVEDSGKIYAIYRGNEAIL